jgi:hypothetical protein
MERIPKCVGEHNMKSMRRTDALDHDGADGVT